MRARKVVNRVYQGRTYYRWLLSVSPKAIEQLGWVDGQPLRTYVRGSTLTIEPGVVTGAARKGARSSELEGSIRRRSVGPPRDPLALLRERRMRQPSDTRVWEPPPG